MSFVSDQIRRIDAQLDRLQLSQASKQTSEDKSNLQPLSASSKDSERIERLQYLIKTLSPPSTGSSALVPLSTIKYAIRKANITQISVDSIEASLDTSQENDLTAELEWLLIAKATTQIYGQLISSVLDHTIPLSYDIEYWDDVIGSYRYTALYSLQTSPLRLWKVGKDIYREAAQRRSVQELTQGTGQGWRQFYTLVREVVRERSLADVRKRVMSPLARVRNECRLKRARLRNVRLINANALGVLLGEGLSSPVQAEKRVSAAVVASDDGAAEADTLDERKDQWHYHVTKSIALMDSVMQCYASDSVTVDTYDDAVGVATREHECYPAADSTESVSGSSKVELWEIARSLDALLTTQLPAYQATFARQVELDGRPPRVVRYWLPATVFILSSSTMLQILVRRKAEMITWVQDFGATVRDFWLNWVVEPTRKVIGTIRHDEGSEISIMSKRSLEGDRESLERMVVDFAVQNPEGGSRNLSEAQIEDIRLKVKEGDLTPVLKAYEKDMQSPFMGVVRGNLVRALLIQVQKTKVDVEVAMGGVDSILKSQELLFGLIGLIPGLLVSVGTFRWISGTFGTRSTTRSSRQAGQLLRQLRNIDRILVSASTTEFGELSYRDQGLLLCDLHLLRQDASKIMPKQTYRDFLEDVDELADIRVGIEWQRKVVQRLRWAYSRWIQ